MLVLDWWLWASWVYGDLVGQLGVDSGLEQRTWVSVMEYGLKTEDIMLMSLMSVHHAIEAYQLHMILMHLACSWILGLASSCAYMWEFNVVGDIQIDLARPWIVQHRSRI